MATETYEQQADVNTKAAEQTADRIRELNEQVLDWGRKANVSFLESYEQNLRTWAEWQDKVADQTQVEWLSNLARAQANFTREVTRVYTSTARDLLR